MKAVPSLGAGSAGRRGCSATAAATASAASRAAACSLGAAYGANTDPVRLGAVDGPPARRAPHLLRPATRSTRPSPRRGATCARQRVPWISFKLPYSLGGDGGRRAATPGPATSPASCRGSTARSGSPSTTSPRATATSGRGPRCRSGWPRSSAETAPNVAYSVILTGWNQFYGDSAVLPRRRSGRDTRIDLVGFDVYNKYGVEKDGADDQRAHRLRARLLRRVRAVRRGARHGLGPRGDRAHRPLGRVEPTGSCSTSTTACAGTAASRSPTSTPRSTASPRGA